MVLKEKMENQMKVWKRVRVNSRKKTILKTSFNLMKMSYLI